MAARRSSVKRSASGSGKHMKRTLQALGISLACGAVALGGLVYSFPAEQAGCVGPSPHCLGSGVYIGHGFILTNQHVAMFLSEVSSFRVSGWKYVWRTMDVGIEQTVFLDRDIELGMATAQQKFGLHQPLLG